MPFLDLKPETDPQALTATSDRPVRGRLVIFLWRLLAIVSFAMAVLGALLPVLPTVPFLLLSAWAAGKGWPAFEVWLLQHPRFGPPVLRWRQGGAISRGNKWLATIMMLASAGFLQLFGSIALWVRVAVPLFLLCMCIWVWLRPEQ